MVMLLLSLLLVVVKHTRHSRKHKRSIGCDGIAQFVFLADGRTRTSEKPLCVSLLLQCEKSLSHKAARSINMCFYTNAVQNLVVLNDKKLRLRNVFAFSYRTSSLRGVVNRPR